MSNLNHQASDTSKRGYVYSSFLLFTICCSVASLGFIPSGTAQNILDSEKIKYTHYKTPVNGFLMHYVIGGKGDPIVLLHGWPETWYEWRHIIPELIANNFTVIAPDMRGLGNSEKPQTGYDKKTLADDIYQLVKKLGYNKVYIAAHDWGGPVAGYEEAGNFSPNGIWHFSFHAVRDLPEKLIEDRVVP